MSGGCNSHNPAEGRFGDLSPRLPEGLSLHGTASLNQQGQPGAHFGERRPEGGGDDWEACEQHPALWKPGKEMHRPGFQLVPKLPALGVT